MFRNKEKEYYFYCIGMLDLASKQIGITIYEDEEMELLLRDLNVLSENRSQILSLNFRYEFRYDDCLTMKEVLINEYDSSY
jgi:hypothetical protein